MNRPISIFGSRYVGTVTAACLAHQGNRVINLVNIEKANRLDTVAQYEGICW
ncbi:MAG: hypothetical protein WAL32_11125 [Terriglobales bacterium]